MDILALAAAAAVMGAIITGLLALYSSTAAPRGVLERRLGALLSDGPNFEQAAADLQALRPTRLGRLPLISSLIEGKDWTSQTALRLEGADIRLTVSEYVAMRILVGLLAGMAVMFIFGSGAIGIVLFLVAGFVGWMAPDFYVNFARGRRIRKLDAQLVEALSMISNSLKAGFGLMQSLELCSREMEHPIATEIRRTLHDINVGQSTEEALQSLARRSGSEDLDIVITAMLIQQSTGGNLAEILDNVAHTMRERIRIRGEIKTLTTQQMFTGFIIGGLPLALIFLINLINPNYMDPLFTEPIGIAMLYFACILEFFGIMLINRILAIEV
jgi:tight adherence protein B